MDSDLGQYPIPIPLYDGDFRQALASLFSGGIIVAPFREPLFRGIGHGCPPLCRASRESYFLEMFQKNGTGEERTPDRRRE